MREAISLKISLQTMKSFPRILSRLLLLNLVIACISETDALEPNPDRIVVLTFDDSVANHATFVAPLLKKHGFGATFSSPRDLEDRSVPSKVFT